MVGIISTCIYTVFELKWVLIFVCSTFQVGCLREMGSNGEIGIRSIDAKIP